MKKFILISVTLILIQTSYSQIKVDKVPDRFPVQDSYLFSGKLDSTQYKYFLNGILKEQFNARRDTLRNVLKSRESLLLHIEKIKSEYIKLLGVMPEKTPLHPIITGRIEKENYTIEKIAFESKPNHHITALLYIPKGIGPFPGILHITGHSFIAKGRDYYQRIGRYFALNGFVVLQVDPLGQGERCQIPQEEMGKYFDKNGTPLEQSSTGQHELYNQKLLLLGSGVVAWEAWDNIRSIDYLCSRKEVDRTKIGVTGLSGGGTQTTYLASLDQRIKVVAPSSYIATTEEKFKTIGSQDGCQQLYSEGKLGIEEQDFLLMAAPMPLLVLSTYEDYFSYKGSQIAVNELINMYKTLGVEGRVSQFSDSGEHGMPYSSIKADAKWMSWWLKGDSSHIVHDTVSTDFLPLKETYVTKTGQVLSYFKNEKSVVDFSIEMLDRIKVYKKDFLSNSTYEEIKSKAIELIGYEDVSRINGGSYEGSFIWEGLKIEKHLITRDRGLCLPALVIKPEITIKGKTSAIILAGCFGKMDELVNNKQLVLQKLKEGYVVMIVDVSNTGELRTPEKGINMSYEFSIAKMPIYAGKTLLGYRTEDFIIAKNYLKKMIDIDRVDLLASEQTGPSAIHAAFIDGGFTKLYLKNSPYSWEELIKSHFSPDNVGIIVPNVLKYYDLPDMLNLMQEVQVEIFN